MTAATVILIVILLALQAGDIWTTNRVIALGGREVNPVVAWFQRKTGRLWWVPKLGGIGLAIFGALLAGPPVTLWVLGVLDLFFAWVVVHNWRVLKRLERR